jgi:hypothetical protein
MVMKGMMYVWQEEKKRRFYRIDKINTDRLTPI